MWCCEELSLLVTVVAMVCLGEVVLVVTVAVMICLGEGGWW